MYFPGSVKKNAPKKCITKSIALGQNICDRSVKYLGLGGNIMEKKKQSLVKAVGNNAADTIDYLVARLFKTNLRICFFEYLRY